MGKIREWRFTGRNMYLPASYKYTHKPTWLARYDKKKWATKGNLSKLLDTLFGHDLKTTDVDRFHCAKSSKRLDSWSTKKLPLACRVVICSHVLLSTL